MPAFFRQILRRYEGNAWAGRSYTPRCSTMCRAHCGRDILDAGRAKAVPSALQRIVVAIDPAATADEESSETGIVVPA